jgi:hypothetical protein
MPRGLSVLSEFLSLFEGGTRGFTAGMLDETTCRPVVLDIRSTSYRNRLVLRLKLPEG